jgi:hypothetical protein
MTRSSPQRRLARLQQKQPPRWVPLERAVHIPLTEHQIAEHIAFGAKHGMTEAQVRAEIADVASGELWKNDRYQAAVRPIGGADDAVPMVMLSIKRVDRQVVHDWRDLQAIKNQLVGPECEAVELYPAESRRVDTANQYFLWCVLDPSFRFPWGFNQRLVSSDGGGGAVQRPLDADRC